jgi:hypothetical protein
MVHSLKSLSMVALVAGLVSGCPLASEPASTSPATQVGGTSRVVTQAATSPDPSDPGSDPAATPTEAPTVPTVAGDMIMSDPLDITIERLWSRRVLVNGVEMDWAAAMALVKATKAAGGDVRLTIAPGQRHGIFRLLATDEEEVVHVPNGNAWGWISQLFDFGGYTFSVKKILVSVAKVEVKTEAGEWITIADYGPDAPRIDLMALHQGGYIEFGAFFMEPGNYTRARVRLNPDNKVVVDEGDGDEEKNLSIFPSKHQTIELVKSFTVASQGLTSLRIDFNVKRSIFRFFGFYVMRPVFKVLGTESGTVVSRPVTAADGGVLALQGDVSLTIPAGALAEDTVVTLRPEYFLRPHATTGLLTVGHEYVVEPEDLQLSSPATLAISINPSYRQALGLEPAGYLVNRYDSALDQWVAGSSASNAEGVSGSIEQFGRFAASGEVSYSDDAACGWVSDASQLVNQKDGLDVAYFAAQCRRQNDCYAHGFKTYGKSSGACDDDLANDLLMRCEDLCRDDGQFGKACGELTAEEVSAGGLAIGLYQQCRAVAARIHTEAVARHDERFPGDAASTCDDYDGVGVSCAAPTCSIVASPAVIPADTPSNIEFTVTGSGSVESMSFDGSNVYAASGLPYLPSTPVAEVLDANRILVEDREFVATVVGPGGQSQCSVVVTAIPLPKPCVMTITPNVIAAGGSATLFTAILPGYNTAFADFRNQGVYGQVGLTPPDADGKRYFTSTIRPTASRVYHARVVHDNGSEFVCQAGITVQ